MRDIIQARYSPADWNIYAAQASDGDNMLSDCDLAARLLTEAILPATQFFAYLEVSEGVTSVFDEMPDSSLWTLYEKLVAGGAPLSIRRVCERSQIYPVFHDLFQRRGAGERVAS
jgi:uncharacterized sporulation protein YeaH/YhbH (DUF444 family)